MKACLPQLVLTASMLTGCASLSQTECAGADWEQIGYRDGAGGASARRIEAHRKACAEHGIAVDADTYRAGYDRGIDAYCTPENAVRSGLSGGQYSGVCPGRTGLMFEQYYGAARAVGEQRRRVAVLEQQRRGLERALDDAEADDDRYTLRRDLRQLDAALYRESDRLRYLEMQLFR